MTKDEVLALIDQRFNDNYYSGAPRVPPHTHNGIDNLKISNSSGNGQIGIGGLYLTTTTNNPSTELGYGTWTSYGAGYALVGYKSGDANFGTLGATVGAATVTLTSSQIPAHTHVINAGNTAAAISNGSGNTGFNSGAFGTVTAVQPNTGGGGSHANIQPSIVINVWQRTA